MVHSTTVHNGYPPPDDQTDQAILNAISKKHHKEYKVTSTVENPIRKNKKHLPYTPKNQYGIDLSLENLEEGLKEYNSNYHKDLYWLTKTEKWEKENRLQLPIELKSNNSLLRRWWDSVNAGAYMNVEITSDTIRDFFRRANEYGWEATK